MSACKTDCTIDLTKSFSTPRSALASPSDTASTRCKWFLQTHVLFTRLDCYPVWQGLSIDWEDTLFPRTTTIPTTTTSVISFIERLWST